MPGVIAVVSWNGPLKDEVRAAAQSVHREAAASPGGAAEAYESDAVFIGAARFDGAGLVVLDGKVTAIHGEIVEPGLTVGLSGAEGLRRIAQRAAESGAEGLRGLNGHYAAIHWDEAAGTLHAVADRLAGMSLYLWERPGYAVLTSRLSALTAFPEFTGPVDRQGAADLMTLGCCIAGRTLLTGVETLPWAMHIEWRDGVGRRTRYWDLHFENAGPAKSVDAYADDLAELVRAQIRLRAGLRIVLPLSGGYDSRILAAACAEVMPSEDLAAYTLGDRFSHDGRYAPAIAKALGIAHETMPIPEVYFRDFGDQGAERVDGMVIGHTCWRMAADGFLQRHRDWVVLNGWAGDQFRLSPLVAPMAERSGLTDQFDFFYDKSTAWRIMNEAELARLFRPEVYADIAGAARETLAKAYREAPADNPAQRLDFVQWTLVSPRRYQRMNRDYTEAYCRVHQPFREKAIAEFLRTLPPEVRTNGAIMSRMVARHWPRVARIPSSHGGLPIAASWSARQIHRTIGWWRYKALPRVTAGRVRYPNPGTYVHYLDWLRGANRGFVEAILADEAYLEDLFDMDYVRRMTADVLDGRSPDYGKVYNLASFALYRKRLDRVPAPV